MKKRLVLLSTLIITLFTSGLLHSQGGMWLPDLLRQNEDNMKSLGMKISAEDIYSVDNPGIKDAVVLFGGGCTGEFVSDKGLLFTNHHCGYSYIVKHSTIERDLLTNGFASKSMSEELPCPGLSVSLLEYMSDVTNEVTKGVKNDDSQEERNRKVKENCDKIINGITADNQLFAQIKPLYYGNKYYLYVYKVYKDVRLVAAPPSNIGKFGGDTDNWMWPRHTGDFSVFRVYASKDNSPAEYSKDNVPYKPKKFLNISLKTKQEGDFTFVMGYPGTTQRFLTSYAVDDIQNYEDPARIKIRTAILDIYNEQMQKSPAQRLRYASRVASVANGWKKWQGEVKGLKFLNVIDRKQQLEDGNPLMSEFQEIYSKNRPYKLEQLYLSEAVFSSKFMQQTRQLLDLIDLSRSDKVTDEALKVMADKILANLTAYYEDDYQNQRLVDRKVFVDVMTIFYNDFAKEHYNFLREKVAYGKDVEHYFAKVYDGSLLSSPDKIKKLLKNYKRSYYKKLSDDSAVEFLSPIYEQYINSTKSILTENNNKIDSLYRIYTEQTILNTENTKYQSIGLWPDANLTMRVTYGQIASFKPKDGVFYSPFTTIKGIMEKENPEIYDYVVENKLKDIYNNNDVFPYGDTVAFIATNQTTGGNSGSPVLDADGNLIGINFDRNWEGTMSDIYYDKNLCRNISLDIRYCLLIIDKYLGAKNIIDELVIIK